jgi:hypothetical protein
MSFCSLKHAIGIFSDRQTAEQALEELKNTGFPMDKIAVVAKANQQKTKPETTETTETTPESELLNRVQGAFAGLVTGGAAGGFLTTRAGLIILPIPGVGPALALESILAALLKGGVVATVSGLIGALKGWFVPTEQAEFYGDRFSHGDYLVVIEATEAEIRMAEPILMQLGIRAWQIYDAP